MNINNNIKNAMLVCLYCFIMPERAIKLIMAKTIMMAEIVDVR